MVESKVKVSRTDLALLSHQYDIRVNAATEEPQAALPSHMYDKWTLGETPLTLPLVLCLLVFFFFSSFLPTALFFFFVLISFPSSYLFFSLILYFSLFPLLAPPTLISSFLSSIHSFSLIHIYLSSSLTMPSFILY